MAHHKAERFQKLVTQTPVDVGPGTYDIIDLPQLPGHLDHAYPFLSGAKRQTLSVPKDAEQFPAPNCYNIKDQRHIPERNPGGVSIDYTDPRFKNKIYEGPGPAEYEIPEETPRIIRSHPGTWRGPAGKLWLARPPRSIIPSGTAIPTRFDANGYDFDEKGLLVKKPPTIYEPRFFYDVPREDANFTTRRYKGNFWSKMTGRSAARVLPTPAPGDYEHEIKKTAAQMHDEKIREAKRGCSRQLRYLDSLYRQQMRNNFPAPNSYKPKGTFDKYYKISCKCDPYQLEPPAFNQTAKRFDDKAQFDTPGPGTYEPHNRIHCIGSIYQAPFGVCAARYKDINLRSDTDGPAPGDYHTNVGNLAYESAKRFKCRHEKPIFYIGYDKSLITESDEDCNAVNYEEETESKKCPVYHAAFKSKTERFKQILKGADTPDPGAYEALAAFKVNRDKCDFLCARLTAPFGARGNRFPKIPDGIDMHVPGASRYDLRSDIASNVKGGVISNLREDRQEETPSPAHYCIHPYFESSVLIKSFNASLGKPIVIRELEKKKKQGPRARCRPTKKKLRWFAVPIEKYNHCPTICNKD